MERLKYRTRGNLAKIVSLSALSLAAAVPAATRLACCAAEAGQQLGSGFLSVLSGLASPDSEDNAAAAVDSDDVTGPSKQALPFRMQSWSEKLMSLLAKHRSSGDLEVELSLDALDQPHVSVNGEDAQAMEAALMQDPTVLQEFRELALDRSADLGGPASASLSAAPLSLKITQRDGQVQAAWQ